MQDRHHYTGGAGSVDGPDPLATMGWAAAAAGVSTLRDAVKAGSWLCGPPEHIVERPQELQARLPGLERVDVQSTISTPERVVVEQLEWFGAKVLLAFPGRVGAASPPA